MDKDNASKTPIYTPTATDDDAITTSTESDTTFDTWTLVTDKKQQQTADEKPTTTTTTATKTSGVQVLDDQRRRNTKDVETEENDDIDEDSERHESQHEHEHEHDSSLDELSDGISIISENDGESSGAVGGDDGRISPHPFLREHLNDLSFKFGSGTGGLDDLPLHLPEHLEVKSAVEKTSQMRQRRNTRRSCTPTKTTSAIAEQALQPAKTSNSLLLAMPPIVVRGLTGIFYACVALVVLAFFGKLRHMAWNETLGGVGHPPIEQLEQKLSDIELQNNLMRAEIDLLSKQVNYLNSLKDKSSPYQQQQQQQHQSSEHYNYKKRNANDETAKKGKAFKAWLGNGKTIEPVDITKDDLHLPYKCDDGKFVEVAGMCLDSVPEVETLVDEFGNVLNEALKPSVLEATEPKQPIVDSATQPQQANPQTPEQTHQQPQQMRSESSTGQFGEDRKPQPAEGYAANSKERRQNFENESKYQRQAQQKQHKQYEPQQQQQQSQHARKHHNGSNEHNDDDDDSKEHKKHHKRGYNSKERRHHHNKSDEDNDDNSKERRSNNNNNKQQYKKQSYDSKERTNNNNNNKKSQRRNSEERRDGDWHEKRMQQREHARHQQERDNNNNSNKNWYFKRGDSREKIRHGDSGERQR